MIRFLTHNWQTLGTWLFFYLLIAGSLHAFTNLQLDTMQNRGSGSQAVKMINRFEF